MVRTPHSPPTTLRFQGMQRVGKDGGHTTDGEQQKKLREGVCVVALVAVLQVEFKRPTEGRI